MKKLDIPVTEQKLQALLARMEACGLQEEDVAETFVRSQGPGGQKVNKTSTCVCLKHLPTGLEVKMQKDRSQAMNRFYARRRMCELLETEDIGQATPEAVKQQKIRKQKQRRKRRSSSTQS